jgi:hypothetical protein
VAETTLRRILAIADKKVSRAAFGSGYSFLAGGNVHGQIGVLHQTCLDVVSPRAKRSFTEPKGLNASIFTKRFASGGASLPILTIGVLPTVSRIFSNLRPIL